MWPFYQSNDDVLLRLIAEGRLVPGEGPSPFLLTINIVIGKLLAALYGAAPSVPWYDLLMGASVLAAAAALLFVWGRRELHWTIVFALMLLLPAFVRMQFTVAAMLCATAGVALLARDRPIPGGLLFVWGSLLRFEAAILILLLAWPFVWSRRRAFVLPVVAAAALFGVNHLVYRLTPGWRDFYEFNLLRCRLGEYLPEERVTPAALARLHREAGWSPNDLALFTDWFSMLFPLEEVRRAADALPGPLSAKKGLQSVQFFVTSMRAGLLLMLVYVAGRGRRVVLRFIVVIAAMLLIVFLTGMATKPPPPWISWPLVICALTLLMLPRSDPPRRWITQAMMLLALILTVRQLRSIRTAAAPAAVLESSNTTYVLHGGAYPYERHWHPFRPAANFGFIPLGSSAQTLPIQNYLRRNGWTDLPWSLCTDSRLMLIAYPHIPPRLERYVQEHRHATVHFEQVGVNAWRCRAAPPPPRPPARPSSPATAATAATGG